jgi:hypothetical protein
VSLGDGGGSSAATAGVGGLGWVHSPFSWIDAL